MKLRVEQMNRLLHEVIRTVDHWWDGTHAPDDLRFTRQVLDVPLVTYRDYVKWEYCANSAKYESTSILISFQIEEGTNYIELEVKRIDNANKSLTYAPFCLISSEGTEVELSENTGFPIHPFSLKEINKLNDMIADTVHDFLKIYKTSNDIKDSEGIEFKQSAVIDLRSDPLIEFFCKFLKKYFVFIPNVAQQMNDMEYNEIETNVYFDEEGGFTIKANPDFKGSRPAPEFLFKKKHETYLINFNGEEDVMFIDFPKKTIAYLNEEKLEYQSRRFWSLFERELLGVEYKYPKNEYNGILPKTIYVFDTQYLENGALIQLYIKEDTDFSKKLGLTKGYYYNAMVVDHTNDKQVVMVQIHSKIEDKFVTEALWADVANNKIDIMRKG